MGTMSARTTLGLPPSHGLFHTACSPWPSQHSEPQSPAPSPRQGSWGLHQSSHHTPDPGITTTQTEMGPGDPWNLHNMAPGRGVMEGNLGLPSGQRDSRPRTGPCWYRVCGENTLRGECGSCSQRPGFGYRLCHPTSCVSLGTFLSLSEPQFSHMHPLPLGQGLRPSCLLPHPAPEQTGTCWP